MRYVILRDDDTNALTPPELLERLYRPFLARGWPVNLAVIPEVATDTRMANGEREGYLLNQRSQPEGRVAIGDSPDLVRYLLENPGYQVLQHGCHHDPCEFNRHSRSDLASRLERGTSLLLQAGFPQPDTFVPPYDSISRAGLREVSSRFGVVSTGWFEWRRIPFAWWPRYALKKMRGAAHWKAGGTLLLSHPGCLLSCMRPAQSIFDAIIANLNSRQLTVLVTHWWEYFCNGRTNDTLIGILHRTADYIEHQSGIRVTSFAAVASGNIPLR